MAREKKKRVDTTASGFGGNFGAKFGALLAQSGIDLSAAEPAPEAAAPVEPVAGAGLADCDKVVLRKERKGRKGKTVTLVEGLEMLDAAALDTLAKTLRKAMGCGATVEAGGLVLQGDQRAAARKHLERLGARKVVG